ncbi:MAG TPA: pilus assembly protein, partial [Cupriavidus sp.]|nr:pilus assembly protein [Cupriavidus sp.]
RRAALLQAGNRGVVLADQSPADPYVRAIGVLLERLGFREGQVPERSVLARIKEKLPQMLRPVRAARVGN